MKCYVLPMVSLCALAPLVLAALSQPAQAQIYTPQWKIGGPTSNRDSVEAPGKPREVHGVTLDSKGNLYVAGQYCIQKFDPSGRFLLKFGERGTGNGQFQWGIGGIAVDKSGTVFVSDWSNARIQKFASDGTFLSTFGTKGGGNGQFFQPGALALDQNDNLFVADNDTSRSGSYSNRIQKFSPSGRFFARYNTGRCMIRSLATDAAGNLYFLGIPFIGKPIVAKVTVSGKCTILAAASKSVGEEANDGCITLDRANNLYVLDTNACRVRIWNSQGTLLSQFGTHDGLMPAGIVVDGKSDVYVGVYGNEQAYVRKFRRRYLAP